MINCRSYLKILHFEYVIKKIVFKKIKKIKIYIKNFFLNLYKKVKKYVKLRNLLTKFERRVIM